MRSSSLKYLDARTRSVTRAGPEFLFVLCQSFIFDDDFLDVTRAADELHSCSAQQSKGNRPER
eukprot:1902441-Pyramimonas_sp.AAC.1